MSYHLAQLQHSAHYITSALRYENGDRLTGSNTKHLYQLLLSCLSNLAKDDKSNIVVDPVEHQNKLDPFFAMLQEMAIHFPSDTVYIIKRNGRSHQKEYLFEQSDQSEIEQFANSFIKQCRQDGAPLMPEVALRIQVEFQSEIQQIMQGIGPANVSVDNKRIKKFYRTLADEGIDCPNHQDLGRTVDQRFYVKTHFYSFHEARHSKRVQEVYHRYREERLDRTKQECAEVKEALRIQENIARARKRKSQASVPLFQDDMGASSAESIMSEALYAEAGIPHASIDEGYHADTEVMSDLVSDMQSLTLSRDDSLDSLAEDVIYENKNHLNPPPLVCHYQLLTAQQERQLRKERDLKIQRDRDQKYSLKCV